MWAVSIISYIKNTLGSLRLDSFVFTLSVWRYLYIWIHRVKLFKYLELGQNRFLALVLILVLRHFPYVDINLIYLTPQCGVVHYQELVRIASTLPLRVLTFVEQDNGRLHLTPSHQRGQTSTDRQTSSNMSLQHGAGREEGGPSHRRGHKGSSLLRIQC